MKIGIITVHRAYNYGSVLQCFALQEYLKSLGHDVWVIDYRQKWTEATYGSFFSWYYVWQYIKAKDIHSIIGYWRGRRGKDLYVSQSKLMFTSFMNKLHLTEPCRRNVPADFDIYLIGSDQLWSYQCVGGKDKIYTGNFKHPVGSKVIGYAISAGVDSLYRFGEKGLKAILDNFDRVSLREENNSRIVKELTGIELPVTIDPVLLPDASMWESMINKQWQQYNYIVIYQARPVNGMPNYLQEKARILARQLHCEIVELNTMNHSVEDFISAIKYAKYVMTTSFHAVVFSVLMETPCFAIRLGDGLDVRYVDLLMKLGLEQELVEKDFTPISFTVDFYKAKKNLLAYQNASRDYLNKI